MKNTLFLLLSTAAAMVFFSSCEDFTYPSDGVETDSLYVSFAQNYSENDTIIEGGDAFDFTIILPVSQFEEYTDVTLGITGDAVIDTDFEIVKQDDTQDFYSIQSTSATEVVVRLEYRPLNGGDLENDLAFLSVVPLDDLVADGPKTLILTVEGGVSQNGFEYKGGRNSIRGVLPLVIDEP